MVTSIPVLQQRHLQSIVFTGAAGLCTCTVFFKACNFLICSNVPLETFVQSRMCFLQGRLEVVAIIISAYPSFSSGLTNIAKQWFLIFIFIKSRAAVTGGRNTNATLAQIPNVGRNATSDTVKH